MLLAAYEQASSLRDKQHQRAVTLGAQQRMLAAAFSIKDLFNAAENLYKKPVRLHVAVHELLVRVHAETAVGLAKSVAVRELRAKQAQTQSLAGGGVGAAADRRAAAASKAAAAVTAAAGGSSAAAVAGGAAGGSGGGSGAGGVSPASLVAQIEAMHEWARDAHGKARLVHAHLTRLTASTSGWLTGGERGELAACVRQLQVECAPGVTLPVPMQAGFFPPGTTVTAMEVKDEFSDALGWQQAGARLGGAVGMAAAAATAPPEAGGSNRGRGTFNVMICLPSLPGHAGSASELDRAASFAEAVGAERGEVLLSSAARSASTSFSTAASGGGSSVGGRSGGGGGGGQRGS